MHSSFPSPRALWPARAVEAPAPPRAPLRAGLAEPPAGINWARTRTALFRYKWLILILTVVGTGGGVLASRLLAPRYVAQATVWIDQSDRYGGANGPMRTNQPFSAEAWADLLRSYAVLEPVVRDLGLDRVYAPTAIPGTAYTVRDAATRLREALTVRIDEEGNFLRLELSDTDPVRVAATLNAITARYVLVAADLKRQKVNDLTGLLANQVAYASRTLNADERSLEAFRTRGATLPMDVASLRGSGRAGTYDDLEASRDAIWRERTALERILAVPLDSSLDAGELDRLVSTPNGELAGALRDLAVKRGELRQLRLRYADTHPAVRQLAAEIAAVQQGVVIPQVLGALAQLRRRETDLTARLDALGASLRTIPRRDLEEARLRRNIQLSENLHNTLQQRYSEAQLASASSVSDVRILDVAAPPRSPAAFVAPRLILMAGLAGLALGCLLALLLDWSDKRFRYPEQVSRGLGLTILGAVPHVKPLSGTGRRLRDQAMFLEALRDVRLNLSYAYGAAGPVVFTITSPGSADGKSFLALHLARVFAENGRRTVLIDGDLRRGDLHRRFSDTKRQPGITDFLRGETGLEQIVQPTGTPHLDLIASGTRTRTAPELLGAPPMTQLFGELRNRYDAIICDSPPLGAGIDAVVLGAVTGNLLMVVRAGVSLREVAESRLDVIARLPVRVLGAVLNDVPKGSTYSYYSHYHMPGYEAADEAAVLVRADKRIAGGV